MDQASFSVLSQLIFFQTKLLNCGGKKVVKTSKNFFREKLESGKMHCT